MAPLKLKKVVSFSSEDPLFPASNLLVKGKWKCKEEGEKQAWVLLQLEETSLITNIDIGNAGAAFIEIQVGRLGTDPDQMKGLLVASSFMSVNEARVGDNTGRVRMFGQEKLANEVAKEKWDLVKVVLTQPFNKHVRYGISFIALTGPAKENATGQIPSLGKFKLKSDSDQEIAVGSYFAKQKAGHSTPTTSVAASLRADTTVADLAIQKARKEDTKRKREIQLTDAMKDEIKKRKIDAFPRRNSLPGEISEKDEAGGEMFKESDKDKKKKEKDKKNTETNRNRMRQEPKPQKEGSDQKKDKASASASTSKERKKTNKFAPFSELFKGVTFTISGFQNPLRGEIRQKALEMGAKYCGDWNSTCTHLVCAFANTPKFNQVAGKGLIVKKEWVEECHRQRKRLPWRRFCLDRRDEGRTESEEEVWETPRDGAIGIEDYECDTDEEIEKIKNEEVKERESKMKENTDNNQEYDKLELRNRTVIETLSPVEDLGQNLPNDDPYECDTDEEIERIKLEEKKERDTEKKKSSIDKQNEFDELHLRNRTVIETLSPMQDIGRKLEDEEQYDPYECDTDEEIEKIKNDKKQNKENASNDMVDVDPYDVETDIDDEELVKLMPDTRTMNFGTLPNYFDNKEFYLHGEFEPGERQLIERYIVACGGNVQQYMRNKVEFVVTKSQWNKKFDDALEVNRNVQFVRPGWVFKCKDEGKVVDLGQYLVRGGT